MKKRKNIDSLRNNFYNRRNEFQKFEQITEERIKQIIKEAEEFSKITPREFYSPNLYFYMDVLMYLQSSFIYKDYTFDERLIFLIEAVDKELKALQIHNETETISITDINKAKTIEERCTLMYKKDKEAKEIEAKTRKELDFYDRNLRIYEKHYSSKIRNKKKFEESPAKDLTSQLLSDTSQLSFAKITPERFSEINKTAQFWIAETNSEGNQKRAAYNIISQNNILKLTSRIEQIIFFILVVDPNLKAYTIYEENGSWKNIKNEMIQEMGFYSKELIFLEEKYHTSFCPDKFISEFTLTKK